MKLAVPEKGDDRMRSFVYVIRDRAGIAKSLTGLMSMGIRFGDEIRVEVSGGDEAAASAAMEAVLQEHL